MVIPKKQSEQMTERSERVAAHRRIAAVRFSLEEHEANGQGLSRMASDLSRRERWLSSGIELAAA